MRELVLQHPSWGYRRIWAWLVYRDGLTINKKKVARIMREQGWQVHTVVRTPRPRVEHTRSHTQAPHERWAIDATSLWCAWDGWVGVIAVIDCCTREIVGIEIARRGRAQEAQAALEQGCLAKFGLVYPRGEARPVLRSDHGKVFTSRAFVASCKQYGLEQEFITPYTPQQNGMIERFFRSLKRSASGSRTSRPSRKPRPQSKSGSDSTTTSDRTQAFGLSQPRRVRSLN